jgi:hypothetical protein
VLVDGAAPLRPEPALFEAMLEGWRRQQAARRLSGPLIEGRVRLVRRFQAFTGAWVASGGWAHPTIRSYEGALAVFLDFVCGPRYGWVAECEQLAGARPVQVAHEGNAAVHASDYEGRPERRGTGTFRGVAVRNPDGSCAFDKPALREVDMVTSTGTLSF